MKIKHSIIALFSLFSFSCGENPQPQEKTTSEPDSTKAEKIEVVAEMPATLYGIPIQNMEIVNGKIQNNKTLSEILTPFGITQASINQMAQHSKGIFDVRKIRAGNKYALFIDTLAADRPTKHFVYEIDALQYVDFSFGDSITAEKREKPKQIKERLVAGEITSSLWNAITGQGIPFQLAYELSNIYAWNIDFFGLQKGDKFKVKYSEVWVDTSFVAIDSIKCAIFNHCGTDFHAIPFKRGDRLDYFDYEGNNLRKAFLKAPLKYSRITSHFSNSRMHPILKICRPHHGVDYAAPIGTPVMTIGDGRVIDRAFHSGAGNMIKVQHNSMYTSVYMHLSKFAANLKVGSIVKQGDVIGYVGSTGLSTGPHLDFRVYKDKTPINPLKMESPSVEPISPDSMAIYKSIRDKLIEELN